MVYLTMCAFLMAVAVAAYWQSGAVKRLFRKEVAEQFRLQPQSSHELLKEKDIRHLPPVLQAYLHFTGVVGQPPVHNARVRFQGKMRLRRGMGWSRVAVEQYNFYKDFARLFYIQSQLYGIPFFGRDLYRHRRGNMFIKAAGIATVANDQGEAMDRSALVTFFNDMVLFTPATLVDRRCTWQALDNTIVKGTIQDKDLAVSAQIYFNPDGKLVNFITEDRYFMPPGGEPLKIPWSTPVSRYQEINGVKVVQQANAYWYFPEEKYCYAKFTVKSLDYNRQCMV